MQVENYVESMLKISVHVEICNAGWKLCWKHVEKAYWKLQCMLKSVMQVENYVESMLKISMCVENHVKNVYVNHVENRVESCVEIQKKQNNSIKFFSPSLHNFLIWYIFQVTRS